MKYTFNKALISVLIQTFLIGSAFADQRGIINPIVPKSIRKEGESKIDMVKRLMNREPRMSNRVGALMQAHKKMASYEVSEFTKKKSKRRCECCNRRKHCKNFKNFAGYWLLDCITYLEGVTVMELFEDKCGRPFAKLYTGTQLNIRERNLNDENFEFNYPAEANVFPVQILGPRSLRLLPEAPIGEEDLRCTFRIQDNDDKVGYAVYFTDSSEVPTDNLLRYIKLPKRPEIQQNNLPSKTDWTNPVEIFNYWVDMYTYLGQPQIADSLNQTDFIGWADYKALKETMLSTGVIQEAKVSTAYRGGKYIGVWRTQYPADFPVTTIHTQELHHMNPCSTIEISGFKGAYAVLNGTQKAAAFPTPTLSETTPYPWQDEISREHHINILFDSSTIEEEYDPNIHGVATLTAQHGPITPNIGYRDFMAALLEFGLTSFGPGTHTRLTLWLNSDITVPESFEELEDLISNDQFGFPAQVRFRTYTANSAQLYWNPVILNAGSSLNFPTFNLNDPFGVGLAEENPFFDYDIPLQNYLQEGTVKNIFFTVTGPVLEDQPITSILKDMGYTSNGSQVVFAANDYRTFPAPLSDAFGTHEYMIYAGADNSQESVDAASLGYFGGIINKDLTGDTTVAYIRLRAEPGYDDPFTLLTLYALVFGRDDIPNKFTNNFVAAYAALFEELNAYSPDRYILDIRSNNGGFVINNAIASLFGGDRPTGGVALAFPGNGQRDPLIVAGSGIQTVFDSVPDSEQPIPNDIVASVFPKAAVRSDDKHIELIILTSTHAGSSGDVLPHRYLGPDPEATVHNLGNGVTMRIVGDIDGRKWAGFKGFEAPPINPLSQNLTDSEGTPYTSVYGVVEGGLMTTDRNGYIVNATLATRPDLLLPGWFDQTQWQDIGLTPNILPYPLPSNGNGEDTPVFDQENPDSRATWRDVWLENAIVN